jgi:ABC-2 type transport system ATP-binding protein
MAIIMIEGLKKSFKSRKKGKKGLEIVEAVKGIDLSVTQGECFGFLGPNGAGKTTTLKILATLLAADEGKAMVAGYDLRKQPLEVRKNIGYVSQAGGTDSLGTGRENLILQARLYGLSSAEAAARAAELIDALDLGSFVDRRASTYSGGQRRKLDIALGMVHSPKVLFLDEPTTGLDPVSRAQLWERIRLLKSSFTTVFLTTHYLDEADSLCDRIAIIDKGVIVAEGIPLELKRRISGDVLSMTVNHVHNAGEAARQALSDLGFIREAMVDGDKLRLVVAHGGEAIPVVLRLLEGKGIGVAEISLSRPSLDDVFLRVTGHSMRQSDGEAAFTAERAGAEIPASRADTARAS